MLISDIVCPGCIRSEQSIGQPRLNIGLEDVLSYLNGLLGSQNIMDRRELEQIRNLLRLPAGLYDNFDADAQFIEFPTLRMVMRVDCRGMFLANIEQSQEDSDKEAEEGMEEGDEDAEEDNEEAEEEGDGMDYESDVTDIEIED